MKAMRTRTFSDASHGDMRQLAYPSWSTDSGSRHVRMVAPGATGEGVELRVKNRCARDLRVVLGGDPSDRSGSPSTLPARAVLYYHAPAGTPLWLVDESYTPIASTELTDAGAKVEVTPSCDAFARS